jgi:hypothetical protein
MMPDGQIKIKHLIILGIALLVGCLGIYLL